MIGFHGIAFPPQIVGDRWEHAYFLKICLFLKNGVQDHHKQMVPETYCDRTKNCVTKDQYVGNLTLKYHLTMMHDGGLIPSFPNTTTPENGFISIEMNFFRGYRRGSK
jgi:hypothetical protein